MTQPKQAAGSRSGGASRRTRSAPAGKRAGAKAAPPNAPGPEEDREALDALRDAVTRGVLRQFEVVMLTRERIQEALDDAVARGRMTRSDAEDLVADLYRRGRRQTEDLIADLEQLVGRARRSGDEGAPAGAGPALAIRGYDDLTAAQVGAKLPGLTPAELRKIRDYERRNANRKSVLAAVEKALG